MRVTWVNTDKRRYYTVHVVKDLFDTWCVVRAWGSLAPGGRMITLPVAARADGLAAIEAIAKRRQGRGYTRTEG